MDKVINTETAYCGLQVGNPAMAFAVNNLVDYVVPWTVNGSLLTEDLIVETGNPEVSCSSSYPGDCVCSMVVNLQSLLPLYDRSNM